MTEENKETPKNQKMLFIALITVIIILVAIIFMLRSTIEKNYSELLKTAPALSPELCTNREKTASVCKGDIICQCENKNYSNPFFFANNNKDCPDGCNILKPASPEGVLGTCALAFTMASNLPACAQNCSSQDISKKSENLTTECCIVTMESTCAPIY